ncbi:MucB/RseB C-terminal domain-containing protein, partial [Stenotrophomonas sp. YIM B06876]|uniref:MucB/RseB C-terminal domain-containing protein n=1 Tax=Stenotrophomonas sp. YIM B06876 TaxID=3060211 RepID=UPI002739B3A5
FWPQSHTVRNEQREPQGGFPQLPWVSGAAVAQFYSASLLGSERVAGQMADVVWFKPQDALRFGYRIWSAHDSGLVLKLQTLQADGQVLEQAAFSELDLKTPVRMESLARMMDDTAGYRVVNVAMQKTSAAQQGWTLRKPVAGFVPMNCYQHAAKTMPATPGGLQCIYSDGLATVSLFIDRYDEKRHAAQAGQWSMGATHTLA